MYWTKNENWDILCTDEKDIRAINIFYGKGEMPVQIMDVRVLRANRAVYCKIFTDEGIDVIPGLEETFLFCPHKVMTRLNLDGSICDR